MSRWLRKAHDRRCARKQWFARVADATEVAREMSRKHGELFMAYECCDCGNWHVAHADKAQQALMPPLSEIRGNTVNEELCCPECGAIITKKRLHELKGSQQLPTCSKACSVRRGKRGQRGRRAKRQLEERGAEQATMAQTNCTAIGEEPVHGEESSGDDCRRYRDRDVPALPAIFTARSQAAAARLLQLAHPQPQHPPRLPGIRSAILGLLRRARHHGSRRGRGCVSRSS